MASTTTADGGALLLDSIPIVDLRLLSQSELYSLSLCSSSAFDPRRWDDVVIPKIDRSVFNESAGSRKQTYSRLRLAPPSSSSSATPRRRPPHLRPTTITTFANFIINKSDPENAENAQIVTLLKQLFVTDINPWELVPVKIDYAHSLPPQQYSSSPSPSTSNVGPTCHKRKRGRPRRNEHSGTERESATGISAVGIKDKDGFSSLNEIVVRENVEDRDREVLNSDGVAVDLVELAVVEHPYREEIRRRTQGLGTEEELLEYLKGLNGQWGSRRKKKTIVDASEFGTALPIGWKLLLSVKKKNGHVWLYCRRYISPSGLHFVSCKGVSSYLLSLHGVQDTNPHSSAQYSEIVNDADKLTSVAIADLSIQDNDRKENLVSLPSSPAFGSTCHDMQVVIKEGNSQEERIGEIVHCTKCNITFSEKDELLQHQSSIHGRNRYKNGMRITDAVIIKNGKYECQFCCKAFSEKHQYNGHIGAHMRYQAKTAEESLAESVYPSSYNEFPVRDSMIKGSLKSDNYVEICDATINNGLNIFSLCNKDNEHVGDLNEANENIKSVDEGMEINPSSVSEVLFFINENKSFHEDACENGCAAEIMGSRLEAKRSKNCSTLPLDDSIHGVMNGGDIENSASLVKLEESMVFKSSLLNSNNHVEECNVAVNNKHICWTRNELKHDCENFAVDGSVFDFFGSHGDQDTDLAIGVKQQSDFECLPCKKTGTSVNVSTSRSMASKHYTSPNISMLPILHNDKAVAEDNVCCSIGEFGTRDNGSSKEVSRHEEMQLESSSVLPSSNEQKNVYKTCESEALNCPLKEPGVEMASKCKLIAFSGHESMYESENNDDEVCGIKMKDPEFEDFQNFGNGESGDPFSSSDTGLNSHSVTRTVQDKKLGVCSAFKSVSDKQFFTEDNMTRIFNDALEKHKQVSSGGILLGQSRVSEVPDEAYTLNKINDTPANPSKLNEPENTIKDVLSLSFGNLQMELCTDSDRVEEGRYQGGGFDIQSVVHKTYGNETNVSIKNSNIPCDQKQGRPFGIDFCDSSFNSRTHELGNSLNMAQPGRNWNAPREDTIATSGQNFMVGFGNCSSQPGERVTDDDSWRTGRGNVFQGGFDVASGLQVPLSSCFPTSGLTSNKGGEEGSFGVMLTVGGTEPVEYSFMGEQSSNTVPGESKIFSCNANMEQQGLDGPGSASSLFWLGKDALMPNASQATSVCIWCGNDFFHEQVGVQTAAAIAGGTMCTSCTSRIPPHFNLL